MAKTKTAAAKKLKRVAPRTTAKSAQGTCFVISPFGGWFDDYYDAIFEPAIRSAKLNACRADDLYRPSSIIHDIWEYVRAARVLLADLTGKNPNVLYELGLAHAIGKPVVMVTQSLDDVPFDLRNLRVITYDLNHPAWAAVLAESLIHSLEEVLRQPESGVPPAFLKETKASASPQVSPLEKKLLELTQQVDSLRRSQRRAASIGDIPGPQEAIAEMNRLADMGMPDQLIVERLQLRGVPSQFVQEQLNSLKRKRHSRTSSLAEELEADMESRS